MEAKGARGARKMEKNKIKGTHTEEESSPLHEADMNALWLDWWGIIERALVTFTHFFWEEEEEKEI